MSEATPKLEIIKDPIKFEFGLCFALRPNVVSLMKNRDNCCVSVVKVWLRDQYTFNKNSIKNQFKIS